jgi:Glyoxalase/Bleomycin resistance protein/Dioxygenase superfamily
VAPIADRLDHVALHISDPEATAARILAQLPFRIIEETDEFVLVGRDAELGKLTLFHAEGPREQGVLRRIGIGIPCGTVERTMQLDDGLELRLVPSDAEGEVDVESVTLYARDPAASARRWLELGFEPVPRSPTGAVRVKIGSQHVELLPGSPPESRRPLLNHLGVLVESFEDARSEVEHRGIAVDRVVDAENSRALFVTGPDGVELEYIEHKPSFALAS